MFYKMIPKVSKTNSETISGVISTNPISDNSISDSKTHPLIEGLFSISL